MLAPLLIQQLVLTASRTFKSSTRTINPKATAIQHQSDMKTIIWKENAKVDTQTLALVGCGTYAYSEVLFGGSLEGYAIEHNRTVPLLVVKCIDAIEKLGGLQKEGIYRVSGRQTNIEQLKHQFELDEDKVVLDAYDVFTIATVLKMYIRELKRPLFDFNVQTRSSYSSKSILVSVQVPVTHVIQSREYASNSTIPIDGNKAI